ncbi:MAG: SDR family NAD(P)-dependent oxidoreductase, partial [Acidimicrobiia bacterium]
MPDRVVVVTGASGGIGSAIGAAFTALGDIVVGLDLLDGFDVTDPSACTEASARIERDHGRIDVLCNNAGISAVGDVVQSTPEEWERVFAVNVFGAANMSRAIVPTMRAAGTGVIVNTCSVVASVGLVERAVYGASKGAVLALTKSLAVQFA